MYRLDREKCQSVVTKAARKLLQYCRENNIHYLVTGSSGGRDSAITLGIAQRACQMAAKNGYRLTVVAVVMPCKSQAKFTRLGKLAAKTFGAELVTLDLSQLFQYVNDEVINSNNGSEALGLQNQLNDIMGKLGVISTSKWTKKIARGNIMARLRMIALYDIARRLESGMVLSTDNLSELWMGFWTINGDVGDYGMIQNVMKGLELEDIAKYLGVPQAILDEKPDDGLGVTKGGDAEQLGATYPDLDEIMSRLIQQGFNPDGSKKQAANLRRLIEADPKLSRFSETIIDNLAWRSLCTAFKRRGTINLTRKQLGLPAIKSLKLDD